MKLKTNGISTAYYLDGPAGAPVVTLSHSLATSSAMWGPQLAVLAKDYRLLRYDTRGHGGSEVPSGPYSLAELVADVYALLMGLGIEETYFVGLSMGGAIGQLFALTHPQMLRGLVLCNTSAKLAPDAGKVWDERIAVARKQGMEALVETTIGRWFTPAFAEQHPEIIERIGDLIRRTDPVGYTGCIEAIRRTDLLGRLPDLWMRTLVIAGEDDLGLPAARAIQQHIRGSELVVLSPAAHLCNLEQPAAFNKALSDFVASAERDGRRK